MADGTADADAGIARLDAKDPRTAIELFTRAIQSKDLSQENLALTYHRRGMAFYLQGEAGRAILDYTIALWHEDLPKDYRPKTLNNRGRAYEAINHDDSALRDYGLSIRLNPNYPEPYANRGNLRRKFNQNAEAVEDYNMALRMGYTQPQYVFAWQGLAFEAMGKRREAADSYRRALQIDAKFDIAVSHLARLEEERTLSSLIGRKKMPKGVGGPLIVSGSPGLKPPASFPDATGPNSATNDAWSPPAPKVPSITGTRAIRSGQVPASSTQVTAEPGPEIGLRPALGDAPASKNASEPAPLPARPSAPVAIAPAAPTSGPSQVSKTPAIADGEGGSDSEYALQLGSFPSESSAQAGWTHASKTSKALLDGLQHSVESVNVPDKGLVYRLYAGSLPDKQSALKLCRTLRDKGSACIVIKR
jgi:tetratricopeptide (TPR) repeat protein